MVGVDLTELQSGIDKTLLSADVDETSYSSKGQYEAHVLEQYKLYVEMADRISSRRQNANSFFLSVNTALVAVVSYVSLSGAQAGRFAWVVPTAGVALSYMWYRLVRSYKDLNSGKFQVIHAIEKRLPIRPYGAEWEALGKGANKKLYIPFTHVERAVPWVFVFIHAVALIGTLL